MHPPRLGNHQPQPLMHLGLKRRKGRLLPINTDQPALGRAIVILGHNPESRDLEVVHEWVVKKRVVLTGQ